MKKTIASTLIILLSGLLLCACTPRNAQRWNGEWQGNWRITTAEGRWAGSLDSTDQCSVNILLDEEGQGSFELTSQLYGPIFDFTVEAASVKDIELSGSCLPNGEEQYRNSIEKMQTTVISPSQLSISGSYTDPVDGAGHGFSFIIELTKED